MCAKGSINALHHHAGTQAHNFSNGFADGITASFFGSVSQLITQAGLVAEACWLDLQNLKPFGRKNTVPHDAVMAILIIGVDIPSTTQPLDGCNKKHRIRGSPIAFCVFIVLHCLLYKVSDHQVNGHREARVKTRQYLPTQFIKFFNIVRLRHEATHHEE